MSLDALERLRELFADCERDETVFLIPKHRLAALRDLVDRLPFMEVAEIRASLIDEAGGFHAWKSGPVVQLLQRIETPWLTEVLSQQSIRFDYQPIVHAITGEVYANECLMRSSLSGRSVTPDELVEAAKAHDSLLVLDQLCRKIAIESSGDYLSQGHRLFINFFPITIYDPKVCLRTTFGAAERAGADISQLTFEVVESEAFPDLDHLKGILEAYREKGASVALDDLGSGHTAILYIDQLEPDVVKIDKDVLTRAVATNETSMFIGMVRYAQERGITTIAEGIESEKELDFCRELGVDYVQGYFLARPSERPMIGRLEQRRAA